MIKKKIPKLTIMWYHSQTIFILITHVVWHKTCKRLHLHKLDHLIFFRKIQLIRAYSFIQIRKKLLYRLNSEQPWAKSSGQDHFNNVWQTTTMDITCSSNIIFTNFMWHICHEGLFFRIPHHWRWVLMSWYFAYILSHITCLNNVSYHIDK